jgi:hypothetical protein
MVNAGDGPIVPEVAIDMESFTETVSEVGNTNKARPLLQVAVALATVA